MTFLLVFAIIGLLGAGSVLTIARTVHAIDAGDARAPDEGSSSTTGDPDRLWG